MSRIRVFPFSPKLQRTTAACAVSAAPSTVSQRRDWAAYCVVTHMTPWKFVTRNTQQTLWLSSGVSPQPTSLLLETIKCELWSAHPVPARARPSWLKELKCCSSCFRPPPGSSRSSSRALQQSCKMNGPAQPSPAQPSQPQIELNI